jgi:hypothetical protein
LAQARCSSEGQIRASFSVVVVLVANIGGLAAGVARCMRER